MTFISEAFGITKHGLHGKKNKRYWWSGSALGELMNNLNLFPFMYRGILDGNSDFNLLLYDGWYKMEGCSNSPNSAGISWGVLVNITTDKHYKLQVATNNKETIKIRLGSSIFSDWKTVSLT